MVNVLFVCSANICRSPTAEGIFTKLVEEAGLSSQIMIDSAGTSNGHEGSPPDRRSTETARAHGIDISSLRSRPFELGDFKMFDYIMAMDTSHYKFLNMVVPEDDRNKIRLFMEFAKDVEERDVPDPYYGKGGFEKVFTMLSSASEGLLAEIQQAHKL